MCLLLILQRYLLSFRVHELKELLKSIGCSQRGRKNELFQRSNELLQHGSPKIQNKIREIYDRFCHTLFKRHRISSVIGRRVRVGLSVGIFFTPLTTYSSCGSPPCGDLLAQEQSVYGVQLPSSSWPYFPMVSPCTYMPQRRSVFFLLLEMECEFWTYCRKRHIVCSLTDTFSM